jgi:hypothetical protein
LVSLLLLRLPHFVGFFLVPSRRDYLFVLDMVVAAVAARCSSWSLLERAVLVFLVDFPACRVSASLVFPGKASPNRFDLLTPFLGFFLCRVSSSSPPSWALLARGR